MATTDRADQKTLKLKDVRVKNLLAISGYSKTVGDRKVHALMLYFWVHPMRMQFYKHRRSCKRAYNRWVAYMRTNNDLACEARWKED